MFDVRSIRPEIMDRPDADPAALLESYRFIEEVNRFYGGTRVLVDFFEDEIRKKQVPAKQCISILDLGSGDCDIPIHISGWAGRRGVRVEYTCLETREIAVRRAEEKAGGKKGFRILKEDVFSYNPDRVYDYVTASMFLHHFTSEEIIRVIEKYRHAARNAFVINDLMRSSLFYSLTWLRTLFSSSVNRHDALLSIEKGFTVPDMKDILGKIPEITLDIKRMFLFRIRGVVRFRGIAE